MLAGAAPIPASSGQTVRVRLNRSGDLAVGQHLPGPIGLEQLVGRDHDLLQGGARPCSGSRLPMAPMLLVSSEGSIGMAHACRWGSRVWRTGQQASCRSLDAEPANRPSSEDTVDRV
jgi:hypothetical protein